MNWMCISEMPFSGWPEHCYVWFCYEVSINYREWDSVTWGTIPWYLKLKDGCSTSLLCICCLSYCWYDYHYNRCYIGSQLFNQFGIFYSPAMQQCCLHGYDNARILQQLLNIICNQLDLKFLYSAPQCKFPFITPGVRVHSVPAEWQNEYCLSKTCCSCIALLHTLVGHNMCSNC